MGSIRRYLQFVKPYRWQIIATIAIGIIKFAIPMIMPLLIKYVVDDILSNSDLSAAVKLNKLLLILGLMAIMFIVIRPPVEYYRQYFAQWTSNKVLFDLRNTLYKHIKKLSFKYYANIRAGEVISRVINDVEQTKTFVVTGLMNIWLDIATIGIAIILMLMMNVKLTFVSILMFPFYAISVKCFFGNLRNLTRLRSQALAEVQSYLHERVQGMPVIKSFAIEDYEQTQFDKHNHNFLDKALKHTSWNAKSFAVVNTITDISPLFVIGYSAYLVIYQQLSLGEMVAFYAYIERLYDPLRRLVNSSTTLTYHLFQVQQLEKIKTEAI